MTKLLMVQQPDHINMIHLVALFSPPVLQRTGLIHRYKPSYYQKRWITQDQTISPTWSKAMKRALPKWKILWGNVSKRLIKPTETMSRKWKMDLGLRLSSTKLWENRLKSIMLLLVNMPTMFSRFSKSTGPQLLTRKTRNIVSYDLLKRPGKVNSNSFMQRTILIRLFLH